MPANLLNRIWYHLNWEMNYLRLPQPKSRHELTLNEVAIETRLNELGLSISSLEIDASDFQAWVEQAGYETRYQRWFSVYQHNIWEKSLEHYLAAKLLELQPGMVYIDIAGEMAVAADIYAELYNLTVYKQDIKYKP